MKRVGLKDGEEPDRRDPDDPEREDDGLAPADVHGAKSARPSLFRNPSIRYGAPDVDLDGGNGSIRTERGLVASRTLTRTQDGPSNNVEGPIRL